MAVIISAFPVLSYLCQRYILVDPKVTDPFTKSLIGDTDSAENSNLMLIIDSH